MSRIKYLTAGESHGKFLTAIIDGIPAGMDLSADDFKTDAVRRRGGIGRSQRMQIEVSNVFIESGVRNGTTTGAPITLKLENRVHEKWQDILSIEKKPNRGEKITTPRPGHADYAGIVKFGLDDIRDVIERASARETAIRTALGTIAKKFLSVFGINFLSRPLLIGDIRFEYSSLFPTKMDIPNGLEQIVKETQDVYLSRKSDLERLRNQLTEKGDTCGGIFQLISHKVPPGLGSYSQSDQRLSALLAKAVISIPSVKGFGIGSILSSDLSSGSDLMDEFQVGGNDILRSSNNAGGIEGGISNGEPIILCGIVKPVPTTMRPHQTVDIKTNELKSSFYENADLWVTEATGVIAESVIALVMMDVFLDKYGGDSINEIKTRIQI